MWKNNGASIESKGKCQGDVNDNINMSFAMYFNIFAESMFPILKTAKHFCALWQSQCLSTIDIGPFIFCCFNCLITFDCVGWMDLICTELLSMKLSANQRQIAGNNAEKISQTRELIASPGDDFGALASAYIHIALLFVNNRKNCMYAEQ